jgi:hypothetical protein
VLLAGGVFELEHSDWFVADDFGAVPAPTTYASPRVMSSSVPL